MRGIDHMVEVITEDVFGEMQVVYPLRAEMLKKHRYTLNISVAHFAKLCGWPTSFQRRLETPNRTNRLRVSCFQRDKIVAVLLMLCKMQEPKENEDEDC